MYPKDCKGCSSYESLSSSESIATKAQCLARFVPDCICSKCLVKGMCHSKLSCILNARQILKYYPTDGVANQSMRKEIINFCSPEVKTILQNEADNH